MAPPKRLRPAPLDDPPSASSSSSDDDLPPVYKKPEDEVVDEEEDSSEEENDQEEDDEGSSSEEEEVQPPSKNPPPSTPISNPNPKSESGSESESGSDSGSESGSESDSEQQPTPPPNAKVKPLASKPMKAQPQAQAQSQSTPLPARSGTKRANENGSKRATKKTITASGGSHDENDADADGDVKMTSEDSKKMSQRVFTEVDEIAILKGLAEFISKTGKDPMKDPAAFHSFVKKSIKADANSEQLKRKVRGLKLKFTGGGNFTREHDKKAFELSKKVWGNNGVNEAEEIGKVNEKTPKSTKKEVPKKEVPIRNNGSVKKELVTKKGTGKDESDVDKSLALSEMYSFGESAGLSLLNKDAMERGLDLMAESKVDDFAERWRKVQIAEMEVFVARGQLIKDQTRIALEAFKKSIN